MAFNNMLPYWSPRMDESDVTGSGVINAPTGANNCYVVGKKKIVRIVPAVNTYVNFAKLSDTTSLPLATALNGPLLLANKEYFIGTRGNSFMSLSDTTGSVILLNQVDFE